MLIKSKPIKCIGTSNNILKFPKRIINPKNVIAPTEVLNAFICDGVTFVSIFLNIALETTKLEIPRIASNSHLFFYIHDFLKFFFFFVTFQISSHLCYLTNEFINLLQLLRIGVIVSFLQKQGTAQISRKDISQ